MSEMVTAVEPGPVQEMVELTGQKSQPRTVVLGPVQETVRNGDSKEPFATDVGKGSRGVT